jgi:hypothetical protein
MPSSDTPITELLSEQNQSKLTSAAQGLTENDLINLAWNRPTPRTEGLTVTDLNSITAAFEDQFPEGPIEATTSCCCCCCPASCCSAASVTDPLVG